MIHTTHAGVGALVRRAFVLPSALTFCAALGLLVGAQSCGGTGGASTGDTLTGVVLVDFVQASQDNVPLNRVLEFVFSSPIEPKSIGPASIQIRKGPAFGSAVPGKYVVQGARVFFEPELPGLCDLSDGGLQPGSDYRVTAIGGPEEFAIRNLAGAALQATVSATFHTRPDSDPELFEDQIPGVAPYVVSTTPEDGAYPTHPDAAVAAPVLIGQANKVTIVVSENIDPCTVSEDSVRFYQYARGSAGTMPTGFSPESDQTPGDPYTWGSGTNEVPPRRVRATQVLTQDFLGTTLDLVPEFGEFPDNALLVVIVTANVRDFAGNPMTMSAFSFVTENRAAQSATRVIEWIGETPVDMNVSTGEVNTLRAPGKAQGFLLFAGDNDNGANLLRPAGPDSSNGPAGCFASFWQSNDNTPDDFDTQALSGQVNLDTGASRNTCNNSTDGSTAVVWEFRTFRIRGGHVVRVVGVNPAIILVQGDVVIEAGGRLLVKGDGTAGAPNANGATGVGGNASVPKPAGGTGTAGAGDGGQADSDLSADRYSFNGAPGFSSPHYGQPAGRGGSAYPVLTGQGRGNTNTARSIYGYSNRTSPGGGGGGHANGGQTGSALGNGSSPVYLAATVDGAGGALYGNTNGKMAAPEAGSGGGGAGYGRSGPYYPYYYYHVSGGAGGAGGGFLDITSAGNIRVSGTIDASGGRGGNGANYVYDYYGTGGGGGGGGSGGGIRLLTPQSIFFQTTTTVTAAGGAGGAGGSGGYMNPPLNPGGQGGLGRIVLEDSDSVITGYGGANIVPGEGGVGFYRGVFDASRFVGGGLRPLVVTGLLDMGPYDPTFLPPVQSYGGQEDFAAGITNVSSLGLGRTGIFVEVKGYSANPDGTPNLGLSSGWKSVGYFTDSGSELFPIWNLGTPTDVTILPDNTGGSITDANGRQFCQFRFTFFLRNGIGPFDPGHYVDRWTIRFTYDQ